MISRTTYREAFKLALSISLYFAFALWMGWDLPADGATAIALISLDTTGATLQKGLARIGGATIGLIVGLVAVALFAQLPMGMLLFFTLYLAFCGYMMLGAHYDYPWVIAAYLPLLVWIKCYLHEGDAFHYATFRYLETIVGVGFYTIVCVVLWPVNEGNRFRSQGSQALQLFQDLFRGFRAELKTGTPPAEGAQRSRQLASTLSRMDASLDRAYKDTPDVYRRRAYWEDMRTRLRVLSTSLTLWRESIPDVAELNPAGNIPGPQHRLGDQSAEHRPDAGCAGIRPPGAADVRVDPSRPASAGPHRIQGAAGGHPLGFGHDRFGGRSVIGG